MFGPRLTSVFASRWKALWWSALVLATAYCSVPSADQNEGGAPPVPVPADHPSNPWAKD